MATEEVPSERIGHIGVAFKDVCMLIWGGYHTNNAHQGDHYLPTDELWLFESFTKKWKLKLCSGELPMCTSGAAAVLGNENLLYIFGGFTNAGNIRDLFSLDLTTFEWKLLSRNDPVPIAADKLVGWEYNNKLYFFGGFGVTNFPLHVHRANDFNCVNDQMELESSQRGWNNQFVCFDLSTQKWSCPQYRGKAPVARAAHAVARIDKKAFIFGGRHRGYRMNDMHCLDMDTLTWKLCLNLNGPLPPGRSWHSLTPIRLNCLLLYGGYGNHQETPYDDCWFFDTITYQWTELKLSHSMPRLWHSACFIRGEVIIYGGCSDSILNPNPDIPNNSEMVIVVVDPAPLYKLCFNAVIKNYKIFQDLIHSLPLNIKNHVYSGL